MLKDKAIELMNRYGAENAPFVFIINYDMSDCRVWQLSRVPGDVLFNIQGITNEPATVNRSASSSVTVPERILWNVTTEAEDNYRRRFDIVQRHLQRGDSYLVNLTSRMEVETNLSMYDIYLRSRARYKLLSGSEFVCFSPETFLQIDHGIISCCPMKGTIAADSPDAMQRLMASEKEAAEHATIVDLIRNDLSMVATHVRVGNYRYCELLHTNKGDIYQTSSRITGVLPDDFRSRLGEVVFSQLPAGSITGAPKPMTCKIISDAENYDRGFYTGIMGCWHDGVLDSAVMIRFIDNDGEHLWFKAGGGITAKSDCHSEYLETLEKIYVPID